MVDANDWIQYGMNVDVETVIAVAALQLIINSNLEYCWLRIFFFFLFLNLVSFIELVFSEQTNMKVLSLRYKYWWQNDSLPGGHTEVLEYSILFCDAIQKALSNWRNR